MNRFYKYFLKDAEIRKMKTKHLNQLILQTQLRFSQKGVSTLNDFDYSTITKSSTFSGFWWRKGMKNYWHFSTIRWGISVTMKNNYYVNAIAPIFKILINFCFISALIYPFYSSFQIIKSSEMEITAKRFLDSRYARRKKCNNIFTLSKLWFLSEL